MMVRIKVCGITNQQDASIAVGLGVHALGFIFAESPRRVEPEIVRRIVTNVPPFVQTVGVFVNKGLDEIREIVQFCRLDLIQLHGDEPPDLCRALMPKTIKAFQLKDASNLKILRSYSDTTAAILLDTYSRDKRGGTGKTFDWELAVMAKQFGVPVVLSGGLSPSNIKNAILKVRPFAVDVNSGVEDRPGKKDPLLLKRVVEIVSKFNNAIYCQDKEKNTKR
jgi:phosphoribosylanthranilate isomerase